MKTIDKTFYEKHNADEGCAYDARKEEVDDAAIIAWAFSGIDKPDLSEFNKDEKAYIKKRAAQLQRKYTHKKPDPNDPAIAEDGTLSQEYINALLDAVDQKTDFTVDDVDGIITQVNKSFLKEAKPQ